MPFLGEGYGREFDAWSNALNARTIWESKQYEVSRLPGHPLYELLLAFLWPSNHSYFFFNFLSALATAFSAFFLYRIGSKLGLKTALYLALSFLFIPVIFISGTYTIDYNFALLFIIISFWNLLNRNFVAAGILLGLATGYRISSFGFLIPFSILYWNQAFFKKHFQLWLSSTITALICFTPPLLTYGLSFLDFHKPPFPSLANIAFKLSLGIWGLPLLLLLTFILIWLIVKKPPISLKKEFSTSNFLLAIVVILLGQLVVFLRLPFKSEFFIPAIPFIWIFLFAYLKPKLSKLVLLSSLASLLFFGFDYYESYRGAIPSKWAKTFEVAGKSLFVDARQGPIFIDQSKRVNKAQLVNYTIDLLNQTEDKVWLISGWYYPHLLFKYPESPHRIDHYSTKEELETAIQQGYSVYYLPEIGTQNQIMEGHYLADSIGQALITP